MVVPPALDHFLQRKVGPPAVEGRDSGTAPIQILSPVLWYHRKASDTKYRPVFHFRDLLGVMATRTITIMNEKNLTGLWDLMALHFEIYTVPGKVKRQYLLTCKVRICTAVKTYIQGHRSGHLGNDSGMWPCSQYAILTHKTTLQNDLLIRKVYAAVLLFWQNRPETFYR